MAHRALVAYEREDGQYSLHYSHTGAYALRLAGDITLQTPLGGEARHNQWARTLIQAIQAGDTGEVEHLLGEDERPETAVRAEPMATGLTFEAIITERLDYARYEALYVVSLEFQVTAYRALWLGLDEYCNRCLCSDTVGNGALRTVRWHEGRPIGDGYVQGEFQALKGVVGEMVERGVFDLAEAREYIVEKLVEWQSEDSELIVRRPD